MHLVPVIILLVVLLCQHLAQENNLVVNQVNVGEEPRLKWSSSPCSSLSCWFNVNKSIHLIPLFTERILFNTSLSMSQTHYIRTSGVCAQSLDYDKAKDGTLLIFLFSLLLWKVMLFREECWRSCGHSAGKTSSVNWCIDHSDLGVPLHAIPAMMQLCLLFQKWKRRILK